MFTVLGVLLTVVRLIGARSVLQRSSGVNVHLWWGLVMLVFGVVMFLLGRHGPATARLTEKSPEGRKLGEMGHHTGIEK